MSDMKPAGIKIKLGEKNYTLRFDLNTIDDIQHEFKRPVGDLSELIQDPIEGFRNLKKILSIMINAGIAYDNYINGKSDKDVNEKIVGMLIDPDNLAQYSGHIFKAVSSGTPEPEEGDNDPNPQNAQ